MGMRIGHMASATAASGAGAAGFAQRQQGMKDLFASLQSGDLAGAQKAYDGLAAGRTPNPDSPLAQLGKALQGGDLAGAQQAAQAMQLARANGHHHHRSSAPADGGAASPAPSGSGDGSTAGTLINLTA